MYFAKMVFMSFYGLFKNGLPLNPLPKKKNSVVSFISYVVMGFLTTFAPIAQSNVVIQYDDASLFSKDIDANTTLANNVVGKNSDIKQHLTPITVGALAFAAPDIVYNRWAPTIKRIGQDTGVTLELIPLTPDELANRVARDELDFIIGNALITVALKKDYGVSQLLSLVPNNHASPVHAVGTALVAKRSLNIDNLADLKNLSLVSSDPNAFGGFQIIAGEMIDQGMNPLKDLKHLSFVGFPQDKLLTHVLDGEADVAILPSCVLESAISNGLVPPNSLHVLLPRPLIEFDCQTSTQLYPSYAFSKLGNTDHKTATKIVRAMLDIKPEDQQAIDGRYQYWSVPVNDSHVFKLLKKLQRWPFVTNWQRLMMEASPWVVLVVIALLLGYLHHMRVKRLVVKRTQALSDEMALHQQTQKALFEQQRQFYKAQRILLTGEMASGIAHELNQPLAGIRYLTQGCIYRLDEQQTELKSALTKAIQQVDRAQNTIKRFRQFCQQPSVYEDCDLSDLIKDTLNLMRPDFNRMHFKPELSLWPLTVSVDVSLMQQVLVNLIRNALDALEGSDHPNLQISVIDVMDCAYIQISDNGVGLSEQALKRLFFPFESSKATGLGLGMVVCKRIVEEHGGKISAFNNNASTKAVNNDKLPTATLLSQYHQSGLTVLITLPLKGASSV